MFRLVLLAIAIAIAACGGSSSTGVDAATSAACVEATTYSNLANIESKIFMASCTFSGCHNGAATTAGRLNLKTGMAHATLVDVDSKLDPAFKMVVPGNAAKSYLLVMLGQIAPQDADPATTPPSSAIGLMPQGTGGALLCPEKRAAIERWIVAGAAND